MKNVFVFSGQIGCGKSTISKGFANRIRAVWIGFGNTVREIAAERGLPITRESLQRLGANLIEKELKSFCKRAISATASLDATLVIDGLRHRVMLDELRVILNPRKTICIHIDAPLALRLERVKKRDGLTAEQLSALENHSTECDIDSLKKLADFQSENALSPDKCVDAIVQWATERKLI